MANKRRQTDPELARLMERMREELALELGLEGVHEGYFGEATTAQCGRFGRLLQTRAKQLLGQSGGHAKRAGRKPPNA